MHTISDYFFFQHFLLCGCYNCTLEKGKIQDPSRLSVFYIERGAVNVIACACVSNFQYRFFERFCALVGSVTSFHCTRTRKFYIYKLVDELIMSYIGDSFRSMSCLRHFYELEKSVSLMSCRILLQNSKRPDEVLLPIKSKIVW